MFDNNKRIGRTIALQESFVHLRIQLISIQSYFFNIVEAVDDIFFKTNFTGIIHFLEIRFL